MHLLRLFRMKEVLPQSRSAPYQPSLVPVGINEKFVSFKQSLVESQSNKRQKTPSGNILTFFNDSIS